MLDLGIEDCSTDPNKDYSYNKDKLDSFRKRILDDKTLVSRTDDVFLLSFLRAKNFDEDSAFKRIKKYYEARKRFPALFENFVPSGIEKFFDARLAGYMNKTNENGSVLIIGICRYWDPSDMTVWDVSRGYLLMLDALLNDYLVQSNGVIIVADFRQITWKHMIKFTPNYLYAMIYSMIGCYPLSYKQIHVIINQKLASWLISTFFLFCSKKIQERIFIHADCKSLHKFVQPKYLPSDFGGETIPFDLMDCYEKIKANEQHFKHWESYWTRDEKK